MRPIFIISAYFGLFLFGLSDSIRSPVFPEILAVLNISQTKGGLIFALSSGFAFVGSLASYQCLKRFDMDRVFLFSLAILGVGILGFAFAQSLLFFLFTAALFGLGMGMVGVLVNLYIYEGAPLQLQRRLFSGLHSMYGLACLTSPLLIVLTQGMGISWRYGFIWTAALIFMFFIFRLVTTQKKIVAKEKLATPQMGSGLRTSLILSFIIGWYVVAEILVATRLAVFLKNEHGFDLSRSSYWLTTFFVFLLFGRALGAFFHLPGKLSHWIAGSLISTLIALVLGLTLHPFFLLLTGLTMSICYPCAISYLSLAQGLNVQKVMSISLAMQCLLTFKMHLIVGWMTDVIGIRLSFLYAGLALLIALFSLLYIEKQGVVREAA